MSAQMAQNGVPTVLADPFSAEFLADPYPGLEELREVGPVFWLERYGCWGAARYGEVRAVLDDWQTFISGAGVGLVHAQKGKPWRPPSVILEADPPLHTRTRSVLAKIMSPIAIKRLKETFLVEAERMIEPLLERENIDGVKDLAELYPVKVFADAIGLDDDGRENALAYSTIAFNAFGPQNEVFEASMTRADEVLAWVGSKCRREALAPGAFGAQIFEAADRGELTAEEAPLLIRSFLTAGIDTTVYGLGSTLYCFARHPEQWQRVREEPARVRAAFEEVLRYESPVTVFFRTASRDVDLAGAPIKTDDKILVFFGSANRDPRQWERPDEFDITRQTLGHVGFGHGIHGCVGQQIARLEAEAVFSTLARRVRSIELTGEPEPLINNTLKGFKSLPMRLVPA